MFPAVVAVAVVDDDFFVGNFSFFAPPPHAVMAGISPDRTIRATRLVPRIDLEATDMNTTSFFCWQKEFHVFSINHTDFNTVRQPHLRNRLKETFRLLRNY